MPPPGQLPFISYAQNFEDVMLWRALKEVTEGFYIDVGAGSPRDDSVTLAFYERGWHGINLEPNSELHGHFLVERPRDITLKLAVADRSGKSVMSFFDNSGLSTLDPLVAQQRVNEGHVLRLDPVEVATLGSLWSMYVPPEVEVHFLKVDVEGLERQVLAGNDWSRNRPWIAVVESTRPLSPEASHEDWEDILTEAGYLFAYADGLNRFYVAQAHEALLDRFKYPPNFFDYFELAKVSRAQARALAAEAELRSLYASRSWRLTRPLRSAAQTNRRLRADLARALTWVRRKRFGPP